MFPFQMGPFPGLLSI